jgi:transcriptional regulator of acetoin/glycerol metabolism
MRPVTISWAPFLQTAINRRQTQERTERLKVGFSLSSLANGAEALVARGSLMAGRLLVGMRPLEIVGGSPGTVGLRAQIGRIARFASSMLISGPSGTGKELVARQIHGLSPRASHPFVPVDCASMAGELMSGQLFGHVAGAFTGANCDRLCFRFKSLQRKSPTRRPLGWLSPVWPGQSMPADARSANAGRFQGPQAAPVA